MQDKMELRGEKRIDLTEEQVTEEMGQGDREEQNL